MQRTVHRTLATAAATALLALAGAAAGTPAHAEVDADVLRGAVTAHVNSAIDAGALGTNLVELPNPASGVL
ncbi:hypothetical protein [Streptomyces sp. NPDC006193]|uniref:hypothetical protein n=1 Tax=Streptomyces sp. NPDC006193 TaxID=3155717 RepID=UPI0033B44D2A